jgi:hypothetical protein
VRMRRARHAATANRERAQKMAESLRIQHDKPR